MSSYKDIVARPRFLSSVACLILSSVAFALMPRAYQLSYEPSAYGGVSWIVWLLLSISSFTCIFLLLTSASKDDRLDILPVAILLLNSMIVLSLPLLKGYYSASRHDQLIHIAQVRDIVLYGELARNNFYPVIHIIPSILAFMGLSPELAVNSLPMVLVIVYTVFVYILAKALFINRGEVIIAVMLATLLLMPIEGTVKSMSIVVIVFTVMLAALVRFLKVTSVRQGILLVMLIAISPFVHAHLVVVTLIVIAIGIAVNFNWTNIKLTIPAAIVMVLVFMFWYWGKTPVNMSVEAINALTTGGSQPEVGQVSISYWEQVQTWIEMARLSRIEVAWLVIKLYGGEIIIGGLAILSLVFTRWYRDKNKLLMVILFSVSLTLFILYFFGQLGVIKEQASPFCARLLPYIATLSLVIATPFIYRIITKFRSVYLTGLMSLVFTVTAIFSIFNAYPDPLTMQPNQQCSYADIEGAKWLIDNINPETKVAHLGVPLNHYVMTIYGKRFYSTHPEFHKVTRRHPKYEEITIHLGYNTHDTMYDVFDEPTYLVVFKSDRLLYETAWKPTIPSRWTREDFERLEKDPTSVMVFQNSDVTVYRILPPSQHFEGEGD